MTPLDPVRNAGYCDLYFSDFTVLLTEPDTPKLCCQATSALFETFIVLMS